VREDRCGPLAPVVPWVERQLRVRMHQMTPGTDQPRCHAIFVREAVTAALRRALTGLPHRLAAALLRHAVGL
jgi:hypothetical protein